MDDTRFDAVIRGVDAGVVERRDGFKGLVGVSLGQALGRVAPRQPAQAKPKKI